MNETRESGGKSGMRGVVDVGWLVRVGDCGGGRGGCRGSERHVSRNELCALPRWGVCVKVWIEEVRVCLGRHQRWMCPVLGGYLTKGYGREVGRAPRRVGGGVGGGSKWVGEKGDQMGSSGIMPP